MTSTLQQRRSRETRDLVLGAAHRVFSERGYTGATMEDIAAQSGASLGAIYHHFQGKEDLFRTLMENLLRADLRMVVQLPPVSSFDSLIDMALAHWVRYIQHNGATGRLFMEFWAMAIREPWAHEILARSTRRLERFIGGALKAGQDAGFVDGRLNTATAARMILATIEGINPLLRVTESVDFGELRRTWSQMIQRFVTSGREGDAGVLNEKLEALSKRLLAETEEL